MNATIELENKYCANNYQPLPVVLTQGDGIYVWDDQGKKYIDMTSAYSAVSHGHCNTRLLAVLTQQASKLSVISRAFYTDRLAFFLQRACELTGQEKALPMNTGAEAVETALKAARKWAYTVKGVENDQAEIIACEGNFHGRTISIVSMSTEKKYKEGFGPLTPGFKLIPYGQEQALEEAITKNTAAFIVEPIQGEGGIILPPEGYLKRCAEICRKHNVLLICDEVQTGLGRTGALLASSHEGVKPDGVILGKALGGGLLPISLFLSRAEVIDVFTPGDHGSTFGGNPLAAAVGLEALNIIIEEKYSLRAEQLGNYLMSRLYEIKSPYIKAIRGKGLMIGLEIDPQRITAHELCLKLLNHGILSKETHHRVIRLAPPLIITQEQVDEAIKKIAQALAM